MINKIHFGKRIALLRQKQGLTQAGLSEKLGVTPQAVSKWERGIALPDIDILLQISILYSVSINSLLEDADLLADLTGVSSNKNGITLFVPEEERAYNQSWANEIVSGRWVPRNWECAMSRHSCLDDVGKRIAAHGGIIVEIGTGPGGGFVPYILKADAHATIIISDLSPTVVKEWKRYLEQKLQSPNLYYAAFDFCSMPFKDNSIDVISDGGGIGNAEGDKAQALKEAYRVLKPGGLLVTSTGFVTKETLDSLPKEVQTELRKKRPDVLEGLYEDTVLAGFTRIDSIISGHWYTDGDESTIADMARRLGVNLKFTSYVRYCEK